MRLELNVKLTRSQERELTRYILNAFELYKGRRAHLAQAAGVEELIKPCLRWSCELGEVRGQLEALREAFPKLVVWARIEVAGGWYD